jgi:hypothetical protein
MTFHHHIVKATTLGLVALALGASAASAAPMTYQERQAVASRGQGAPVPSFPTATRQIDLVSPVSAQPTESSDSGVDWALLAGIIAAGLVACAALVAVVRRHMTAATPR